MLLPKTSIPEIKWPALPVPAAATMLAVQYQFEQSQWWTPVELQTQQLRQLNLVLNHAYDTVPYYRDSFNAAGFRPGKHIMPDEWSRVPLLKRKDIQKAEKKLYSKEVLPHHGKVHEIWTSGSTGRPISVGSTQITQFFWQAFTLRDHLWHHRNFGGKLAVIRHAEEGKGIPPLGIKANGWGPSTDTTYVTGPSCFLNISSSINEQAEWLCRENPDYLLTYPSSLHALAQYFQASGQVLPNLREVRTLGETLGPDVRNLCRQAWNVPLVDVYTSQELGYIALQCPKHEHYHVQSENILVEILNENNETCRAGEIGKVVISALHNFATPLIRYEVGDYAEVGEHCDCGRGLPVIKRIMGRVRNMIILPNGEQRWPVFGYKQFEDIAPIRQIQTIQDTLNHLEMKLVSTTPVTPEQEARLLQVVRNSLGYPFEISFSYYDEIPRAANGKYEEFISKVKK